MELPHDLAQMDAWELRDLTAALIAKLQERDQVLSRRDEELKYKQLKIDQLTHEMAVLKRWRYGKRSEQFDAVQRSLLDESIDADLEAIELEIGGAAQTLGEIKGAAAPGRATERSPAAWCPARAGQSPMQLRLRPGAHRRKCE
jgi:hypothetical protein